MQKHAMDAFILAAGRGERLRPLTDTTPKPLVEVGGRPLIERHIERLAGAGFTRIVVNVAWLGERIITSLGDGERFGLEIVYSVEPPGALETAGGVAHALPLLQSECFVLVSADIWTDFDFASLAPRPGYEAGLVLVDNPNHHPGGDFMLDGDLVATRPADRSGLTYAGIGWYRRALFERLAPGRRPLRPVLEAAIARRRVCGRRHRGHWIDIGTPERLLEAADLALSTAHATGDRR